MFEKKKKKKQRIPPERGRPKPKTEDLAGNFSNDCGDGNDERPKSNRLKVMLHKTIRNHDF